MVLYFITASKNKFQEVKAILDEIEQLNLDLPELQELDAKKIIEDKLKKALDNHPDKEFIVEDTSLYINSLNGLPGPLIKWFLKSVGENGIYNLSPNGDAEAKTIIGYTKNENEFHFFEGSIKGKIVFPRGKNGFGWDRIFQPSGHNKTFAEMTKEEKFKISMRTVAVNKLKNFLSK